MTVEVPVRDETIASNNAKIMVRSPAGPFSAQKTLGTHLGLSLCVPVNVS